MSLDAGDLLALKLSAVTFVSALVMELLSVRKDFAGTQPFLRRAFPTASEEAIFRADVILVVFIGTFIGMVFFQPQTMAQALSAGFGWVGVLKVLSSPNTRQPG